MRLSKLQKKKNNLNSSYWHKRALKEWAKIIRYAGRCEKCGSADNLQAHHIQSKAFRGTRFMLDNGIALCPKCHKFGKTSAHQSLLFYEWLRTVHPKRYRWILDNYDREEDRDYKTIYEELEMVIGE